MDDNLDNNLPVQNSLSQASSNQTVTLNLSISDVKSLAGWATFVAVIEIIIGALSCLTILGASYGVVQIISGVKLFSATDLLKRYIATNNLTMISESLLNLNKYFKLKGITVIIKICFGIVVAIFYVIIIVVVIASASNSYNSWNMNFLFR